MTNCLGGFGLFCPRGCPRNIPDAAVTENTEVIGGIGGTTAENQIVQTRRRVVNRAEAKERP